MADCLNWCYNNKSLTESQSQALITLIQKPGKDTRLFNAWRPISLINVDAKIISKILAKRLENIMPLLISKEQAAFVKGRYIGEPIRLIADMLYETNKKCIPGYLFAADFQAAFDSIDFSILFQVLKKYGFSDAFIQWIRILHCNSKSCVMNGGHSTGYFKLCRGTRQGDPLAPYLFILVIEILVSMVRDNKNIKGIMVNGKEIKQCIFADDTTYFLRDLDSLKELKLTIHEFSKISSLCVNYEKSEIAGIGCNKNLELPEVGIREVNLKCDCIRILGIYFSYNKALQNEQNFDRVKNNFKIVLNIWRGRTLSLYGKTVILKTLAIPKLLYVCCMSEIPSGFVKEIKQIICNFLWNGGVSKIKYDALIGDLGDGGLNFPDIASYIETQKIMWVKRLLEDDYKQWKIIPSIYTSTICTRKTLGSNFNVKCIPKNCIPFYKHCLESWSKFTYVQPKSSEEVMIQPLFNNRLLDFTLPKVFTSFMTKNNIFTVKDIYKPNGSIKSFSDVVPLKSKQYRQHYLNWLSLVKQIPTYWKQFISNEKPFLKTFNASNTKTIIINGKLINESQLDSKLIYSSIVSHKCVFPKNRVNLEYKYGNDFDWCGTCSNIKKLPLTIIVELSSLR